MGFSPALSSSSGASIIRPNGRFVDDWSSSTKNLIPSKWSPLSASPLLSSSSLSSNEDGSDNNEPFSLSSLFGNKERKPEQKVRRSRNNEPSDEISHPAQRPHISPLNLLAPDSAIPSPRSLKKNVEPLPTHPSVVSGVLPNGLSYCILPNGSPEGRFEAHLQVFSGSADELEPQQGIAHLTEHVAYMGSRKRERLFGTGSQTNAYTDFHHTVFYAACPVIMPGSVGGIKKEGRTMLPMALDALCDVMEARCDSSRLEKERQAVLSEMTMVNTMEYRVECQILGTLHRENRLAKRFPIGKERLIRTWTTDDVKSWHGTHYRPDNVLLYIVGDVDPSVAEKTVADVFGHLTAKGQAARIRLLPELGEDIKDLADAVVGMDDVVKGSQSWHYPPVRHDWTFPFTTDKETDGKDEVLSSLRGNNNNAQAGVDSSNGAKIIDASVKKVEEKYDLHLQEDYSMDEKVDILKTDEISPGKRIRPHIFRHELLQAFSLHIFAKRKIEPIVDIPSLRRSLALRVALATLQIRLNVGGRSDDPAFTFVEFNQLDSAREGCAICSLDMTAEPHRWREAVKTSIAEIRKLGVYGVTPGEMERYASALITDAQQLAAMGDQISHGDQLSHLMETVANGHTFMSTSQSYDATRRALTTLTLGEVNLAAKDLCGHITALHDSEEAHDGLLIATACSPKSKAGGSVPLQPGEEAYCDEESLVKTIREACQIKVEPEEDIIVPRTLLPEEDLARAVLENPPTWNSGHFTDGTPDIPSDRITRPFTLRRLGNGMRIGVAQNPAESQRGHLRLVAPGGRDAERRLGFPSGSMAVGARTMQEGGAFGPWTREQVELFCVDHLLMVEINCGEESITMDMTFPTNNVGNVGFGDDVKLGITGTEAVLQILREVVVGFHWEEDALGRSKQSYRSAHEALQKNLEGKSTEMIMQAMTDGDERFLSIDVDTVNAVNLEDAKSAVMSQLLPSGLELSMAGDFDVEEVLNMVLQYLGTIPADANSEYHRGKVENTKNSPNPFGSVPIPATSGKFLELELSDSDPRAVSYVSGKAPNLWGYMADGTSVVQRIAAQDKRASDYDKRRRAHPLFANVALSLLSEIVNRRLFSYVRERKQLTYDANFSLTGFERLMGGWFLVTVTASKEKAQAALVACKETLQTLRKSNPVSVDNLESAKRVVLNRHEGELRASSYWTMLMSGIQEETVPLKGPLSVTDYRAVVESITSRDLQLTLECLGLDDSELFTAIGRTVQPEGQAQNEDDVVQMQPVASRGRGGALMG